MRKAHAFIAAVGFFAFVALGMGPNGSQPFRRGDGIKPMQPLRDVTVTVKNVDTGAWRTITTDGAGALSGLRPASGAL